MYNFINKLHIKELNCLNNTNYCSLNTEINYKLNIALNNKIPKFDLKKILLSMQYNSKGNYITNNKEF